MITMNRLFKATTFVVGMAVLSACGNSGSNTQDQASVSAEPENTAAVENATFQVKDGQLNAVLEQYFALNKALIASDFAEAKVAANAVELGVKSLAGAEKLIELAGKLAAATDLDAQRAAYSPLSNELIEKVKSTGLDKGEIYVDYCPMALKDTGASWLSLEKGIKNPYFGDSMLTCGEVKETIK